MFIQKIQKVPMSVKAKTDAALNLLPHGMTAISCRESLTDSHPHTPSPALGARKSR